MKINSIIFIIGILLLISCMSKQKRPVLDISRDVIDFGVIKGDSILKVYFEYKNSGSASLRMIKANADCGCTDVKYDKEVLFPGEKGIIEVIYQPGTNNDSGHISKNIAIMTNAQIPIKVIRIEGVVKK